MFLLFFLFYCCCSVKSRKLQLSPRITAAASLNRVTYFRYFLLCPAIGHCSSSSSMGLWGLEAAQALEQDISHFDFRGVQLDDGGRK
jgi:hypothetical protein